MKGRLVALLVAVLVGLTISTGYTADTTVRWDLVSVDFTASPVTVSAGGSAAALANDGSLIKLTGSGTFVAPDDGGGTADAILTQFLSLLRRKTFEASWWRTALAGATAYVAQTGEPLPRRGAAAPALLPEAKALFLTHFVTFLPEIMSSTPKGSLCREHTNKQMPWTRSGDRLCGGNWAQQAEK